MFGKVGSYSLQWDESYQTGGTPAVLPISSENAVQVINKVRCLGDLSVASNSGVVVWLGIWDTLVTGGSPNPAAIALGDQRMITPPTPLSAPGFYQSSVHGGIELRYGLWIGAYTTDALAAAGGAPNAGNCLYISARFGASRMFPV